MRPVIMFAYFFPPENITGAARPFRFYKYFPEQGWKPTVITASEQSQVVPGVYFVRDEVRHAISAEHGRRGLNGQVERVVRRFLMPGEDGLMWSRTAARRALELLPEGPQRPVLYSTAPPVSVHLAALQAKRRRPDAIWIADFRDPLRGNPFRAKSGLPARMDSAIEERIFRSADLVIANTDTTAAMWRGRYPQYTDKIQTIWNGFDPTDTIHAELLPPRSQKVLCHTGNLYGGRHPGVLLSSIARLTDAGVLRAESIRIQLIGPVAEKCIPNPETLQALIRAGCVEFVPRMVPKPEARKAMATADGLLLLDLNEHNTDLQVPAKLFEYLQIGRPVLAWTARRSPSDRILEQSGIRYCSIYPDDNTERVDEQVVRYFSLPSEATPISDWTRSQFDSSRQTKMVCRIVENL